MRAVFFDEHGGLERLQVGERPIPDPRPGEVRIRVSAAALNHLDLFVLAGMPGITVPLPHIPGSDGAGIVDAVGAGVEWPSVGEAVCINPGLWCGSCEHCGAGEHSLCVSFGLTGEHTDGTLAEFVCVPAVSCVSIPAGFTVEEAAAWPLTFLTAWRMLVTRAHLRAGETVLIHGIGGGVSLAALAIACRAGARVAVTSSSRTKLDRAATLGAEVCIDYRKEDVGRAVREWTAKRGVDVVVDHVGAQSWAASLKCAARGGRIVTCGATTGPNPEEELRLIFWKQLTILGSTMGSAEEMRQVASAMGTGGMRPVVDRILPFAEARQGFARLQAAEQFGKIVVRVDPPF